MKVFLDEQLTGLTVFLKSLDWDVANVNTENMRGSPDIEIVKHAKENNYTLITQDEKASQLAGLHKVPCVFLSFAKLAEIAHSELLKIEQVQT
jgi:predicted nuclease of predicted toxin-antitoxin system